MALPGFSGATKAATLLGRNTAVGEVAAAEPLLLPLSVPPVAAEKEAASGEDIPADQKLVQLSTCLQAASLRSAAAASWQRRVVGARSTTASHTRQYSVG
jgi:hypothetical protein